MPERFRLNGGGFQFLAKLLLAVLAVGSLAAPARSAESRELAHDDGAAVAARSIAASGHAVRFLTEHSQVVRMIRVYGSRYGEYQSPPDRFRVWLCDARFNVLSEFHFPLARFAWGNEKWVDLEIEPTRVPKEFIVCLGFDPTQYKGVYVHFDGRPSGHSSVGIPNQVLRPFELGDWMIRVKLDEAAPADRAGVLSKLFGRPTTLYLLNLVFAVLAISGLGLFAAKLAGENRPRLRHGLLCTVLGLSLLCPLALALAGQLQVGALAVAVERPTSDVAGGETSNRHGAGDALTGDLKTRPAHDVIGAATTSAVDSPSPAVGAIVRRAVQLTTLVWVAGAVVVFGRWVQGMLAIRRLRRSLHPIDCPRLVGLAGRAFRAVGLNRDIPIFTSPLAPGPLALGTWRGVIVLPEGVDAELGDDELVCVLAHEAAHITRRDALVALVQRFAAAGFWWNPLLHAINRRIQYARECICDDCAVRVCGDGEHLAVALVKVAAWCFKPRTPMAGAALLFDEGHLRHRITRLTQGEQTMATRSRPMAAFALLALAIVTPAFVFVPVLRAQTFKLTQTKPAVSTKQSRSNLLSYNDGTGESKRSIAGAGEMVSFTLPNEKDKVAGIRIHGSRYGNPQAPKENVMIYFLNSDMSEVVATKTAPYSRFKRGPQGWVDIRFPKPIDVPKEFWVCVDFRAERTKGVYVSIDDSTDGSHSRTGLPGGESRDANVGGDWMIEAILAK